MKYIRKLILLILFSLAYNVQAQYILSNNLVPNPSFENYSNCPYNQGEIYFAIGWFNGCGWNPDYFNSCNSDTMTCSTPKNGFTYQLPKSGNAYSGIHTYSYTPDFREYIAVKLKNSLKKNSRYCIKFYTSFAATSHSVDLIGAYFSLDSIACVNTNNLFNKAPQICNSYGNILIDTLNWMKISGNFISTGGEKYLYIGDFYPDSQNTIIPFNLSYTYTISYYFIDDVSVCDCEDFKPKLGKDTTLCAGQQILLKANVPKEADSVIYTWQDGSKDSTYLVTQPGIYWVSAYIEDYKITVTDTITVNYEECNTPQLWIPNSFTPNGDGLNDKFEYGNAENYEIKTTIYNRWGQLIFEGENANFWDGKYKGKIVTLGIYTYRIEATDKTNREKKIHCGRITVVD